MDFRLAKLSGKASVSGEPETVLDAEPQDLTSPGAVLYDLITGRNSA